MGKNEIDYIWTDKKRTLFGLPLSFTRYFLTENKFITRVGLLITEKETCWEKLQKEHRPVYIYGMGDGAIKIMSVFKKYGIKTAGIFASDDFVRGHYFQGFRVMRLSEVEERESDFAVVLAFGGGYEVLVVSI